MKVTTKSCNSSQAGLPSHKIMSFSTSQLFYLFLFLTVFPLAVFNVLWLLGLQQAIASSFFWNFIRLGLFSVLIVRYSHPLFYKCKNRCFHLKDIYSSATLATPFLLNLVSMKFPDTNGDSVTSHLLVTKAVMLGWNPLRGDDSAALIQSSNLLLSQSDLSLGRVETGIGFQAIQAFYNHLFSISSSYTFVNSLFIMSALFCLIDSRILVKSNAQNREVTNKVSRNICIGILFLMSPIIIQQLFSAYTDLAGYALIFTAVVLFLKTHSLKSGDKKLWLTFGVIILVMPTIKLQLVALVIPLVTGFLTRSSLSLIKQTFLQQGTDKHAGRGITWQIVIKTLFILSLAIFPVGPLAASTLTGNLPLHSDKKWVANTWSGSIPEFMELNGFERVQTVFAGRTALNPDAILLNGLFSIPTSYEIHDAGYLDSRVAGFGPLWGDSLLTAGVFSLILSIIASRILKKNKQKRMAANSFTPKKKKKTDELFAHSLRMVYVTGYLIVAYYLISLVMPLSFMARYNPQYILILYLSLYLIWHFTHLLNGHLRINRWAKRMSLALYSTILVNFVIILTSFLNIQMEAHDGVQKLIVQKRYLESTNVSSDFKYYFSNKSGLLLATTGKLTESAYKNNVIESCPKEKIAWVLSDEVGICKVN